MIEVVVDWWRIWKQCWVYCVCVAAVVMVEIVVVYISGHKLMVKEGMIVMNMI